MIVAGLEGLWALELVIKRFPEKMVPKESGEKRQTSD